MVCACGVSTVHAEEQPVPLFVNVPRFDGETRVLSTLTTGDRVFQGYVQSFGEEPDVYASFALVAGYRRDALQAHLSLLSPLMERQSMLVKAGVAIGLAHTF